MTTWLFGHELATSGHLVWTAPLAGGIAAVLVTLALVLAVRPVAEVRRRLPELLFALLAGAVVTMGAAGPTWVEEGERVEPGRMVVLIDASRSMDVRESDGNSRSAAVPGILERIGPAEVWSFGDTMRAGPPGVYDAGQTDIAGALGAIAQRYAGEKLAGVVLVTDGLDRGGLRRRVLAGEETSLPALGGPLTVVQVGRDERRPDLSVTEVEAGAFAFLRTPTTVLVRVRAQGLGLTSTPVTLTRDGQPVGTRTATLDADGVGTATFVVTPDAVGRYILEATVPVPEGDAVPSNNTMIRAVRVVRDHVRVLQVTGSPSLDQKFLRLFLKEDPGVDLVSFFILRTEADFGAGYSGNELSLIQFPYERLFSTDLWSFDLVILQNFDYGPYFDGGGDELLANLARFVKEGGALAMLGGDRSFDLGEYAGTPLAEVLPVELGLGADSVDPALFRPELTDEGRRHPVTQIALPADNERAWGQLAELDGTNLNLGPAKGAAVLLSHPSRRTKSGAPMPVLAVAERGAGRTLALTVDASWRWSFDEAGAGRGNQAYLRFWKNALRWLVGDPEDQPVTLETTRENYPLGEEVRVVARVRDIGFSPVDGAAVSLTVTGPGGRTELTGTTTSDGAALFSLPAASRGAWRARVNATSKTGQRLGSASTVFAVTTRDPELEEIDPQSGFLRALAASAGGLYIGPDAWKDPLVDPAAGRVVQERRETPLWTSPLWALGLGVFASASWALRRRFGLR